MLRLWNSRDCATVQAYEHMLRMDTLKQSGPWNSLGTHGSLVVMWWLCISSRVKPENLTFKPNLTLKVKVIPPPPKKKKKIRILTKVFWISGPNLVILAWMDGELWCGQTQNGINLDFQVKFDLKGQGRSVHKTIGTLTHYIIIDW